MKAHDVGCARRRDFFLEIAEHRGANAHRHQRLHRAETRKVINERPRPRKIVARNAIQPLKKDFPEHIFVLKAVHQLHFHIRFKLLYGFLEDTRRTNVPVSCI